LKNKYLNNQDEVVDKSLNFMKFYEEDKNESIVSDKFFDEEAEEFSLRMKPDYSPSKLIISHNNIEPYSR
jgi:hypothetical protein